MSGGAATATHTHARPGDDDVAATVAGHPVRVGDVRAREREVRAGRFAARLPAAHTAQGRNVGRWVVQLLITERIVEHEAHARGLQPAAPDVDLDVHRAVALGGVVATVLATSPWAGPVRDAVTADVVVPDAVVRQHYDRNLDRFTGPGRLDLDRVDGDGVRPWDGVRLGELPASWEERLLAARPGEPVTVAPGRTFVVRRSRAAVVQEFTDVRAALTAELREAARDAVFAAWIGERFAADVDLSHDFAHPGDPSHPDATHRH